MLWLEEKAKAQGFRLIIGIDEAGRGPLAGPVVAAAVALREEQFVNRVDDSKALSACQREKAFHEILDKAFVGIGIMSEAVVDTHNILNASFLAMEQAVLDLVRQLPSPQKEEIGKPRHTVLLVDGNRFKSTLPYTVQTVVKGDSQSLSIAGASIVAKVTRDRILNIYDQVFPEYGFEQHKGYPTESHREAIRKFGPSLIHRKTFQHV